MFKPYISTSGPNGTSYVRPLNLQRHVSGIGDDSSAAGWQLPIERIFNGSLSGLGKDGKIADAIDSISQGLSKAIRGDKPDYSLSQPIPIQNVILIVGLGYVAYKILALAVKK